MKNDSYLYYYNIFKTWKNELLKKHNSYYRLKGYKDTIYSIPRQEIESAIPCYTDDANSRYYKVRAELPTYWFISKGGYLFSAWDRKIKVIKPLTRGYHNNREYYTFSGNNFDPAVLTCLCFNGYAHPKAQELLEKYGLFAFNRSILGNETVRLHHICGYKSGKKSPKETREFNCDIRRVMFITENLHSIISSMAIIKNGYIRKKQVFNLMDISSKGKITVVYGNNKRNGKVIEMNHFPRDIFMNDKAKITNIYIKTGSLYLSDHTGKEIISGLDVPNDFYDSGISNYIEYVEKTNDFINPYCVGFYKNRAVFGNYKQIQ